MSNNRASRDLRKVSYIFANKSIIGLFFEIIVMLKVD